MDSLSQNQSHSGQQDGQNLDNGGGYSFNATPNDAFNSFFNQDPNSSFNASWEPEVLAQSRIQTNGYVQANDAWHQASLNTANNALRAPNYDYQTSDYHDAFARNPPAFRFASFDANPSHNFSNPSYDPALTYNTDNLLDPSGYDIPRPQGYGVSSVQGQTISPQALQSYPTAFGTFATGSQDSQFPNEPLTLLGPSKNAKASEDSINGRRVESIAANIPKGVPRGDMLVKPPSTLATATKSDKFTGYVFLGRDPVTLRAAPAAVLPKIKLRKSMNEIKSKVVNYQGNRPWTSEQRQHLELLGILTSGSSRQTFQGSSRRTSAETDSSSDSASDSELDEESNYSSTSEEDFTNSKPKPLLYSRPTDSSRAVEYDIIKSVWSKTKGNLSGPIIRTALGEFWSIVKVIRDQWKSEMAALSLAETKKDQAKVEQSRTQAVGRRHMMENVIRVTLLHGHRDIVGRLGENEQLLLFFYQLMADRFKDSDYSGSTVLNILQLVERCSTIDQTLLEKVKLDKVLQRLLKRSDEEIKTLAQKVLEKVASYTKLKDSDNKPAQSPLNATSRGPGSVDSSGSGVRVGGSATGMKGQRNSVAPSVQASKKVVPTSASKSSLNASVRTVGTSSKGAQTSKIDTKAPTVAAVADNQAKKIKVNHVVPKQSTFFSTLQSASKKPGTSNAALKAAQQGDGKNSKLLDGKTSSTATSAASKPAFSFAETMANLTKPKEIPSTVKVAETRPQETEEEKTKRLRKEERRKLRVSFKPDESLLEIRTFIHDPEEEMGHDDSMIRDVGDIGSEGRMLKMHKELDSMDEDDDGLPGEITLAPWINPSAVDFSVIAPAELARNCSTRGGKVEIKSHERAVQEQRELTTLMAFYATSSDIPSSPREPLDPNSGSFVEERMFGPPQDETKHREAQFYAHQNPQPQSFHHPGLSAGTSQAPDIGHLLQILNGQQQRQPPQLAPQPQVALEAIFAQYASNNTSVSQMQAAQQSSVLDPSLQAALAAINQQTHPQMGYVPPPPNPSTDLQSMLSQYGQQVATQPQNYNYQVPYQGDNERKRQFEYDDQSANEQFSEGKRVRGNKGKKFFGIPRVPCKFWQEGKCKKGDDCTFLHD